LRKRIEKREKTEQIEKKSGAKLISLAPLLDY